MRSKKYWAILVVVVLVTILSVGLVACKKPVPPIEEPTTEQLYKDVFAKIGGSFAIGANTDFKIDVKAFADMRKVQADGTVSTGDTYNTDDFSIELVAKANVSIHENGSDDDSYFLLELNDKARNTHIIQMYFENQKKVVENEIVTVNEGEYIYLRIFGNDQLFKVKAFSVMQLFKSLQPVTQPETQPTADALDLNSILDLLPSVLATVSDGKVKDNTYTFTFDFNKLWDTVSPFISDGGSLGSLIGVDGATIDGLVAALFGNLTYLDGETQTPVTTLEGLTTYISQNLPTVKADIVIAFDGSDQLTGVTANVNVDLQDATAKDFVVKAGASPMTVGEGYMSKDEVLAGSFVEKHYEQGTGTLADRFTTPVQNLINVNIDGSVSMLDKDQKTVREMDLRIDANIDPFVLINGTNVSDFMQLGSFSIEMQQKGTANYALKLYFDPTKTGNDTLYVYVMLSADNENIVSQNSYVLGGQYSLSGLAALITGDGSHTTPRETPVADAATIDIASIIKMLSGFLTDMKGHAKLDPATGGFIVNTTELFKAVDKILGGETLNSPIMGDLTIGGLVVGKSTKFLNIDIDTFTYGNAETGAFNMDKVFNADVTIDKVNLGNGFIKTETIKPNYSGYDADYLTAKKDGFQLEYGADFDKILGGALAVDYTNTAGKTITNNKLIISKVIGLDNTKPGTQEVTVLLTMQSALADTLGFVNGMLKPMFGEDFQILHYLSTIPVKINVTVMEKQAETAAIRVDGVQSLVVGESLIDSLKPIMILSDGRKIPMRGYNLVTDLAQGSVVDANGNLVAPGVYTLTFESSGARATTKINVAEIKLANTEARFGAAVDDELTIKHTNSNGILVKQVLDAAPTSTKFIMPDGETVLSDEEYKKLFSDPDKCTTLKTDKEMDANPDALKAAKVTGGKLTYTYSFNFEGNDYNIVRQIIVGYAPNSMLGNLQTSIDIFAGQYLPDNIASVTYIDGDSKSTVYAVKWNSDEKKYQLYGNIIDAEDSDEDGDKTDLVRGFVKDSELNFKMHTVSTNTDEDMIDAETGFIKETMLGNVDAKVKYIVMTVQAYGIDFELTSKNAMTFTISNTKTGGIGTVTPNLAAGTKPTAILQENANYSRIPYNGKVYQAYKRADIFSYELCTTSGDPAVVTPSGIMVNVEFFVERNGAEIALLDKDGYIRSEAATVDGGKQRICVRYNILDDKGVTVQTIVEKYGISLDSTISAGSVANLKAGDSYYQGQKTDIKVVKTVAGEVQTPTNEGVVITVLNSKNVDVTASVYDTETKKIKADAPVGTYSFKVVKDGAVYGVIKNITIAAPGYVFTNRTTNIPAAGTLVLDALASCAKKVTINDAGEVVMSETPVTATELKNAGYTILAAMVHTAGKVSIMSADGKITPSMDKEAGTAYSMFGLKIMYMFNAETFECGIGPNA